MKLSLFLLALPLGLAACQSGTTITLQPPITINNAVDSAHTAENSLDWSGKYLGILPCADCEGIYSQLTLQQDKTFVLEEHYMKNGLALHPSKISGRFAFDAKQPSLIRLAAPNQNRVYFIGEGFAEVRDAQSGKRLSDKLNYRLLQVR
ncbi:copper resistance protein NlpE N-terminal domain-containing protein [Vitreoscilla massiliensis]|uniref:Copper resistance protein NlpE N-terminal domain-containing protein n=1 Tax=Vitreoscilla massiliensis TaxID=1689272 RepID=A0ABY4DZ00_9NEIS|nr:copper resistance protein NlpE N-terminal domain-containing protein [Vitreoscilla massiliensis]UOO88750.1 copper resistance protein NlpE N-terminal domain-containing protein [Vitreoscilla massiliensis]